VRHPHAELGAETGQKPAGLRQDLQRRAAVLGRAGPLDRAAQLPDQHLVPVADAEDRHTRLEQPGGRRRGARGVDGRGPAGQDDRLRVLGQHLAHRHRRRHDLRVDVALTHAAGDELGVLRTEVNDQNGVKPTRSGHTNPFHQGVSPCSRKV
jgi:hypothetical protein